MRLAAVDRQCDLWGVCFGEVRPSAQGRKHQFASPQATAATRLKRSASPRGSTTT